MDYSIMMEFLNSNRFSKMLFLSYKSPSPSPSSLKLQAANNFSGRELPKKWCWHKATIDSVFKAPSTRSIKDPTPLLATSVSSYSEEGTCSPRNKSVGKPDIQTICHGLFLIRIEFDKSYLTLQFLGSCFKFGTHGSTWSTPIFSIHFSNRSGYFDKKVRHYSKYNLRSKFWNIKCGIEWWLQ